MHNRQLEAYIYAIIAVVLWASVATAFKLALNRMDVLHLLTLSSTVSTIVLFILILIQKKVAQVFRMSLPDIYHSTILGTLNPFIYYLVLLNAYNLLPAQEAQPLNYLWPITLALLSIPLLKQKIHTGSILSAMVSFGGALIIATHGNPVHLKFSNTLGVYLAIGSTIIWALYWIGNIKDPRDVVVKLFCSFFWGTILSWVLLWLVTDFHCPELPGLAATIYIGCFEMGITFVLWLYAIRLSKTTLQVGSLIYLSPFLSLIFIHYFLAEKIRPSTIVGLICILAGITLQTYFTNSK